MPPADDPSSPAPQRAPTRRARRRGGHDARPGLGRLGEDLACAHLVRRGMTILARNARTRWGELDVVAREGRRLVFVEVKTRRAGAGVVPLEALDARKRSRLRRLVAAWLAEHPERGPADEVRLDAVGVLVDAHGRLVGLEHLEGAW